MTDDLVRRSLGDDARREFDRRVRTQAGRLADALATERFDSPTYALGLELEVYAVDEDCRLTRVPDPVFDECDGELGLHNAELHTDPNPFDADLAWITSDGEPTTDPEPIYDELFEIARRGLRRQDVEEATIDHFLDPIEARWEQRRTPSSWKLDRVREGLDEGQSFPYAVQEMQRAYVRRSGDEEPFSTWPEH